MKKNLTKQDQNIIMLYALLIFSTLMNFVPSISVQTLGGILFFVTFIATYIIRRNAAEGSAHYSHCVFIITTVWIFSLAFIIGIILSVFAADHSTIITIVDQINAGSIPSETAMMDAVKQFGMDNLILFLLLFLPMVCYLLYRFGKGLIVLLKDKPITYLQGWL